MENMEIERKFLVKKIPDNLDTYERMDMIKGYLNTAPVVRVRKENDDYVLTYKGSGLLSHSEYNLPLNKESFEHLLKKCDGIIISKSRYKIPIENNLTAELDIFKGDLDSLKLVEVEFGSVEEANNFIPPEWFGEDVTTDGRYHNSYIYPSTDYLSGDTKKGLELLLKSFLFFYFMYTVFNPGKYTVCFLSPQFIKCKLRFNQMLI